MGADAVLYRHSFDATQDQRVPVVTFLNTAVSSLTATDLGGWSPVGTAAAGTTIVGTALADAGPADLQWHPAGLQGGNGGDTISGLGGNDFINALEGLAPKFFWRYLSYISANAPVTCGVAMLVP